MASILVVERNPDARALLATFLAADGHTLEGVDDGEAALDLVQQGLTPNLVITETDLAGMSGTDLVLVLWQHFPRLPAILIGPPAAAAQLGELPMRDAVGFLARPFDILSVRRVLSDLLSKRSMETQARFRRPSVPIKPVPDEDD